MHAAPQVSPELADAADVLSDQLRTHLERLAKLLEPESARLETQFMNRLRAQGFDPRQRTSLAAITPGAAARILARKHPTLKFIEQVEYNGRRLAKLNLPPSTILEALQEYDRLLAPMLARLSEEDYANFHWVREQLHFCVVLTLNNAYYQVREAETQAFYELFRIELESRNLEELLRRFLASLVTACRADAGRLFMLQDPAKGEGGKEWVLQACSPQPEILKVPNRPGLVKKLSKPRYYHGGPDGAMLDSHWQKRYTSCWSIPLSTGGRVAGVMQFGFKNVYEWLPREQELLAAAAERCLMAAEKARLVEDLAQREETIRGLAEHMLHVEEMERRRISRELHDEAGQSLLCIRLQMELIEQALPDHESESRSKLKEAREMTERTILEMRRLISALSPAVLEQLGLGAALRQLVNRFQRLHLHSRVRLQLTKITAKLPQKIEVIAYRLIQECFNNIGKHAQAKNINVSLATADGSLRLIVEDNGVGFNIPEALAKRESFGLAGMNERVTLLGGSFHVESRTEGAKRGTKISIQLPIDK